MKPLIALQQSIYEIALQQSIGDCCEAFLMVLEFAGGCCEAMDCFTAIYKRLLHSNLWEIAAKEGPCRRSQTTTTMNQDAAVKPLTASQQSIGLIPIYRRLL